VDDSKIPSQNFPEGTEKSQLSYLDPGGHSRNWDLPDTKHKL
jgi:hypothetical protein